VPKIPKNVQSRILIKLEDLRHHLPNSSPSYQFDSLELLCKELDEGSPVPLSELMKFQPADDEFHAWIDFAFAATKLYNLLHQKKLYSILR